MNLDIWMFEDPSQYYGFYGILMEVVLILFFYRLTTSSRTKKLAGLRNGSDEMSILDSQSSSTNPVILDSNRGLGLGAIVILVGYAVTWIIPFVYAPDYIIAGKAWTSFVDGPRFAFLISLAFLLELVSWLPAYRALSTFDAFTEDGIWSFHMTSKDNFIRWNEVSRIRPGSAPGAYRVIAHKGSIDLRVSMPGYNDFTRMAVERLPASIRPTGIFALEEFIRSPREDKEGAMSSSAIPNAELAEGSSAHKSSTAGIGGVLILISGILGILNGIYFVAPSALGVSPSQLSYLGNLETVGYLILVAGICSAIGGLLAIKKRYYRSCVVGGFLGAICAGFTFGFFFGMIGMAVVVLARGQFTRADVRL
jgi:hypothetical protein